MHVAALQQSVWWDVWGIAAALPTCATLSIWVTWPKVPYWGSPLHLPHHKGLSDTHVIPVDRQPYLEEEQQSDTSALNVNTHPSGQNAAFQHQYI